MNKFLNTILITLAVLLGSFGIVHAISILDGQYGGTGLGAFTAGDIFYAISPTKMTRVASSTTNSLLQINSNGAPSWTSSATTTAISASVASTSNFFGAQLGTCNSATNALTWSAGLFGCNTIAGGSLSGGTAGMIMVWASASTATASSVPTVSAITATSSTATTTIAGPIVARLILQGETTLSTSTSPSLDLGTATSSQDRYLTGTSATTMTLSGGYAGQSMKLWKVNPGSTAGAFTINGCHWPQGVPMNFTTTANHMDLVTIDVTNASSTNGSPVTQIECGGISDYGN